MTKSERNRHERILRLAYKLWGEEHWKKFVDAKEVIKADGKTAAEAWDVAEAIYPPPIEYRQTAILQWRAARKKQGNHFIQALALPRPAEGKPDRKSTGDDLLDWVYANWTNPTPEPAHPGDLEQLAYYRKNEKEFRELWTREWRHNRALALKEAAREKRAKEASRKKGPPASELMNEHDAELAKTIAEIR